MPFDRCKKKFNLFLKEKIDESSGVGMIQHEVLFIFNRAAIVDKQNGLCAMAFSYVHGLFATNFT